MVRARRLALLLVLAAVSGCATWPDRPTSTAAEQAAAQLPGFPETIRAWADAPVSEWLAWRTRWAGDRRRAGIRGDQRLLAISSGSDKGAFSAGYLSGWSARGDRPRFGIVTGVSTGALIAPFAFLGPSEDETLRAIYTGVDAKDVFRSRPVSGLLGGPSLADSRPLQRLIARYVTPALLDRIAMEHRAGRRLLVMTTNLDAQRGMVWDLGELAASGAPGRIELFRRVLLASASIPGVFPPVLVDVVAGSRTFAEMHVDGGTVGSAFVLPTELLWSGALATTATPERLEITLLYNGRLDRDYEVVEPRTFSIIARALETVVGESDRQTIRSYRQFAERNGHSLQVEAIGPDFVQEPAGLFDQGYMRDLFAYGMARAR